MNKAAIFGFVISLTSITVTACGSDSPPPRGASPAASLPAATAPAETAAGQTTVSTDATDQGVNLLVGVKGQVLLKRSGWSDFYPTGFGVAVQRGDLLRLPAGAEATLLCDNLNLWRVPGGPAPAGLNGCPRPAEPALIRRGVRIASTRGGDPNVPYLISPRATKLLTTTPTLRWHGPPGAGSYTVQVRGGDLTWTANNVTGTTLRYPGEPPLEPAVTYLLVVEDDAGRSSQDEGARGLGFSILPPSEAAGVEARREQIAGLGLDDTAQQFAIAQYYASQGLTAEAIERLEGLVETGSDEAAVHQALADLYARTGLLLLAQERYGEAISLAESQNNIEVLAGSRASLGEVETRLGNVEAARDDLTQAKLLYETLGASGPVTDIEALLDLLR